MSNILQNVAIIVASLTAVYGIISWRREHIGKRKIDLAEEVLCSIYEIKDVIRNIRSQFGFVGEGSTRKRSDFERKEETEILDNAYVVVERYDKQKDVFNNFYKLQYRYMANFGKSSEEPFIIIKEVIAEIFSAAYMLGKVYWKNQGRKPMTDEEFAKHIEEMEKKENVFWEIKEKDEVTKRIDSAIHICEEICKSSNNLGLWNFYKKYR